MSVITSITTPAGSYPLTITGTSGTIVVSPAAATHFAVSAPGSAATGSAFSFTVTAQDAFNNTVTSYASTMRFTSSDPAASLPSGSTLTNGTGTFTATLKTTGSQTITVTGTGNNTLTGTSNPIAALDANQRYVAQAYLDLLQRSVDHAGLVYWAGLLDLSQITRLQFTQTLISSIEYRVLEIEPLYQNFLHRTIDAGGLKYWSDSLAAGAPLEAIKSSIFGSDEYFRLHASNNDSYLKAVYQDLFGRTIDSGGEQYWLDQMQNHGLTRVALANTFVRLPEAEDTLVKSYYLLYLHHQPDPTGLSFYSAALQKGTLRDEDVVKLLVASDEYFGLSSAR